MKDYIFIEKKKQISIWWWVLTVAVAFSIVGSMERRDNIRRKELETIKGQYRALQSEHYHLWTMDESCSDQLMNSNDGILRIKTK